MTDIQIGNPSAAYWLVVPLVLLILATVDQIRRRRQMNRFGESSFVSRWVQPQRFRWLCHSLVFLSLVLLSVALMDIRWGKEKREVPQSGLEVMFVLDVSRSMLAQDCSPNRLERAKQQIKDLLDLMVGDRVGLVVFGGEAKQEVPLTTHYDDFVKALEAVGPSSVNVGGSRLGDALTKAANGFLDKTNGQRTLIVFTDGEDQESQPVEVAKSLASQKGTRVFTVGLGDLKQGARIPLSSEDGGGYVDFEGRTVFSKLDGATLQAVATETGGAYIPAGTKQVNMADVYFGYVANSEKTEFASATIDAYTSRYHWFALPALCLLLLELYLSKMPVKEKQFVTPAGFGGQSS